MSSLTPTYEQKAAFYHNSQEIKPFFGKFLPAVGAKIHFSTIASTFQVIEHEHIYEAEDNRFVDVKIHLEIFKQPATFRD